MTVDTVTREALIAFLNGEGELDGAWFGGRGPGSDRGLYWWRKYLPLLAHPRMVEINEGDDWRDGWASARKAATELAARHVDMALCQRLFGENARGAFAMAAHLRADFDALPDAPPKPIAKEEGR